MKKEKIKHFVPDKDYDGNGLPACNCFQGGFEAVSLPALPEEIAKRRRGVTCGNCRRTRVFRKLK